MKINNLFFSLLALLLPFNLQAQTSWPLSVFANQHKITGTLGEYRSTNRFHRGTDMVNGADQNVYACNSGTFNYTPDGINSFISISGANTILYFHVNKNPALLNGDPIIVGQLIGTMIDQGGSTHLHLQQSGNNLLSNNLSPFIDLGPPIINSNKIYTNGILNNVNTEQLNTSVLIDGMPYTIVYNKLDLVADVNDPRINFDGNPLIGEGALAPYSIAFEIKDINNNSLSPVTTNLEFESYPSNDKANYTFSAGTTQSIFKYIITNNPFFAPNDRYWNSGLKNFEIETWPNDNTLDARWIGESKYPDDLYIIEIAASDIDFNLNSNTTFENVSVLVDNFRPYVASVKLFDGLTLLYEANWFWDEVGLIFNPSSVTLNGLSDITVQVLASEPLSNLNLSIPELGILAFEMTVVPDQNNMLWEYTLNIADFATAIDLETYQLGFEGSDYSGNNLEINPSNIPIRQLNGNWIPAPVSGTDINHQFLFSNEGGVITPNSFISTYQYWFDENYLDNVTGSTVEVGEFNFNQAVDVSMLSNGMHSFHIRFKDNNSLWSSVLSQLFVKTQTGLADNVINGGEYWFDDNYAGHNDLVGINEASFNFNDNIDVNTLTNGLHSFHIRFKDANNLWSSVLTQFFVKVPQITTPNLISTYEYWFDSDPYASAISITLPTPINPYNLNDVVDVSALTEASHTIHFRFQDINGLWSSVVTDTFTREPLILADFSVSPISICASASVTFDNLSQGATSYLWDFGDGTTSTAPEPTHTYSLGGSYSVTLTASNIDEGLSDILTISNAITVIEPNPLVTASGPTTFCTGSTVTLSTATGFTTYQWYKGAALIPGATSSNYTTNKSGSYKVTVTQGTCSATSAVSVVTVNALPNATVTNQDATNDLCFDASIKLKANGGGGLTYQWYKNGSLLAGATTQNYNAITSGNYKVKVTAPTGCNKTSTPFAIIKTCKEEGDLEAVTQLTVFPNPNDGKYTLVFNSECNSDLLITIYDAVGRVVLEDAGKIEDNLFSKNYDLAGYAKGSYLVMVVCDEGAHYVKVIAQ